MAPGAQYRALALTVQLDLFLRQDSRAPASLESLPVGDRLVPVLFIRNLRARRYVLRVRPDGSARVTIPRGGSKAGALAFARLHTDWIERQLAKRLTQARGPEPWSHGTEVLLRGEKHPLAVSVQNAGLMVGFGDQHFPLREPAADLRPAVERHLRRLAARELPARTVELAALHGVPIRRVTVRNQRSRWGSCSARGTVSLNWRLVQTPEFVRDYIILHELMHTREMNHSRRFWRQVAAVCHRWAEAEAWLKKHAGLLR